MGGFGGNLPSINTLAASDRSRQPADLPLARLADVQNPQSLTGIESALQFLNGDLRNVRRAGQADDTASPARVPPGLYTARLRR